MAIPTIQITGRVLTPAGAAPVRGTITARLSQPGSVLDGSTTQRVAAETSGTIGADGTVTGLALVPNDQIVPSGTYYEVRVRAALPNGNSGEAWSEKWQVPSGSATLDVGSVPRLGVVPGVAVVSAPAVAQAAADAQASATASAASASSSATAAASSASAAAGSASAAETARDAANATGKVYPDTASGIAGVADGAYFSVPASSSGEALILYRRSGAAAVEVKRYPSADAALKPAWAGRYNGWPDPFFRRFDLTSQNFIGRDRWYWNGAGTAAFAGWSRVANAAFDGYALRRAADLGTVPLNGPAIWLDDLGAVEGGTITMYALFVGDGAVVRAPARFDNGTDNGPVGTQLDPTPIQITASATPTAHKHTLTVPVGAKRLTLYPYTSSAGKTFDLVALWAFNGTAGPDWPIAVEESYFRLRDSAIGAAPVIVLPPTLHVTMFREMNVYLDNVTPSDSGALLWEVTTPNLATSSAYQQNERWRYRSTIAHAATPLTITAHDRTTGVEVASATTSVVSSADTAGSGLTPKCIFIGDSLTNAAVYTGELLTIADADAMKIALYGTRGTGANKHEGRPGWTIDFYTKSYSDGSGANPFWIGGAVDFPGYLTANSLPVPDWVFIMLGTNDVFAATSDEAAVALAASEFAKLDTLITSIKAAGGSVRVGLMTPPPPSSDQDAFGASYQAGQSRWRFKRNILLWTRDLITKYGGQTANRVYVVPTHVNLDTVNNMSRAAAAPVNSRSTVQVARQNNGVHPATEGYLQIADTVWSFLKGNA